MWNFNAGKKSLLKDILDNYVKYKCNRDQIIAMHANANNDDLEDMISSKETRSQRSTFARHTIPAIGTNSAKLKYRQQMSR